VFPLPIAIRTLLFANLAAFGLEWLLGDERMLAFALWPLASAAHGGSAFEPWQVVTYSFLHGGVLHLLFNMLGLVTFGSALERTAGPVRVLVLYFVSVLSAAAAQLVVPPLFGAAPAPAIGASGGIFGLLLAYAILFPRSRVLLLIPPIPMPAWVFAVLYTIVELYLGVTGTQAGVAHFAHLGGMVGAAVVVWSWRRRLR
jgi:membrane associated rhomboid family serine protease